MNSIHPALLPVGLLLIALFAGVLRRHRRLPAGPSPDHPETDELRLRLRQVIRLVPKRPPILTGATTSPVSLLVEARLLAGCPSQALDEAEEEVLENPQDGGTMVAMAKALFYCRKEEEARTALSWAARLGADDAEFDYLRARLLRPGLEALRLCLRACTREPGYAEALYLCARLCLRLGFPREGKKLLQGIAPLMQLSVERLSYRRDLLALTAREGQAAIAASEPGGRARRLMRRIHLRFASKQAEGVTI